MKRGQSFHSWNSPFFRLQITKTSPHLLLLIFSSRWLSEKALPISSDSVGALFLFSPSPVIRILKWEQVAFIIFLLASLKSLNLGQVTALQMSTSVQLFLLQGARVRRERKWQQKEVLDRRKKKQRSSVVYRKSKSKNNLLGMKRCENNIFLFF